ncbi:MAG: ECF-type sigma factor [Phycisphaerales bacterium]
MTAHDASREPRDAAAWTATLYTELRRIAGGVAAAGPVSGAVSPTMVMHEAWLKLAGDERPTTSREHQIALAVRTMRQVIIDQARHRGRRKRGGEGWSRISLEGLSACPTDTADLVDLADALAELERLHPRQCQVVEMRFFGGMTNDEVAAVLEVTERTVRTDWRMASAWLRARLADSGDPDRPPESPKE